MRLISTLHRTTPQRGCQETATLEGEVFRGELRRLRGGGDDADYVLGRLGARFTQEELENRFRLLERHVATRKQAKRIIGLIRRIAERTYGVRFENTTPLSERVLLPAMSAESNGMEDARFVRFTEDDGSVTYYASYTAYNGADIGQQLLETEDFLTFTTSPLVGAAAANKGLALFPRRIGGRFAALSRSDRESNTITYSDNPRRWEDGQPCQQPTTSWDVIQLGNCGSPIGDRSGVVGAHPRCRPDAHLQHWCHFARPRRPHSNHRPAAVSRFLSPAHDEQNGYVPNVVYSCGALLHADTLVIPYGIGRLFDRRGDGASGPASRVPDRPPID